MSHSRRHPLVLASFLSKPAISAVPLPYMSICAMAADVAVLADVRIPGGSDLRSSLGLRLLARPLEKRSAVSAHAHVIVLV